MLFTDAPIVTLADLLKIESEIPDVAATENINLDSHIGLCTEEYSEWLMMKMQAMSGYLPPFNVPLTPSLAITSLITQASNRTRVALCQVVVTEGQYPAKTAEIKRILMYETVAKFYRQAMNRREVDRYEKKSEWYSKELTNKYYPRFKKNGCPIVYQPMDAPGAYWEPGAGTWSAASNLSTNAPGSPGTVYDVVITWIDGSKYVSGAVPGNAESGPSARATIAVNSGGQITVSIVGLTAPNGQFRSSMLSNVPVTPLNTTGWNIYAGPTGGTLTLQNSTPIGYGTKSYTLPSTLSASGLPSYPGQYPNISIPIYDMSFRA